ncbi:MAG: alpha/beta hydrolase [Candidatus Heimdallarchaeota archaeon]|nr:alpha/beta hydrolase [Candidatus Heimdallarchaeota archaeon]
MSTEEEMFIHTQDEIEIINKMLRDARRDVPTFMDEGAAEILYVPVDDGELKVYHHIPERSETKRPIVFVPGFVANPKTWIDFHLPHHDIGEYYYIETREKMSSRIKKSRQTLMTIKHTAYDLGLVLKELGLTDKDYLLVGSSYGGSVVLEGLIHEYFSPPTTLVHDPIVKWVWEKSINNVLLRIVPKFILSVMRIFIAHIFTFGMKNKDQKERMIEFARGIEPWKFKRACLQNNKFNNFEDLKEIKEEVFLTTGPLDRYHPRIAYYNYAKEIPKGRFIFMDTPNNDRQLLAGIIGTEFAKQSKDEEIPDKIKQFEIKLKRK